MKNNRNINICKGTIDNGTDFRSTILKSPSEIDDFVLNIADYLRMSGYVNINISDSYPIIVSNRLKYAVTITAEFNGENKK